MNVPEYYERNLPHRLAGSLPLEVIARLKAEAAAPPDIPADYAAQRRYFGRFDAFLDQATTGPTWLRVPAIAALVAEALHHRHGTGYELVAYCIMPNHVHAVVALPDDAPPLLRTLQSLKANTAILANRHLQRTGPF
ncbi:transposase [Hymenobacter siberiensis]|uniref:transposase n=1 Tax=Hymenobacter siberiensis TaxID=2848396 RepID=UPI001C1E35ED|nr:transposase [Hymenobacter siberiensis]MBU6120329.1 transposase [Hymenobacter siberiensis]